MARLTQGYCIGNRYQIVKHLDSGGMGLVFKALDTQLFQRSVAVKVLQQTLVGDTKVQQRLRRQFEAEARVSTILGEHPLIIKILDYGVEDHQPYLVMEYLAGQNLSEVMRQELHLDPWRVVHLGKQICAALHHAHTFETVVDGQVIKGVIHRDIKPSNIFILQDGTLGETVKVLDFGIAKVISDVSVALGTQTTGFLGTVRYASPEQMRGEELDPRSDIYSLGVTLYRMLTGELPFTPKTDSFPAWYEVHNHQIPQPIDHSRLSSPLPPRLEAVVLSCLAKDPNQRPQSMQSLGNQLVAALQEEGSGFFPTPPRFPFSEATLASLDIESFDPPAVSYPTRVLSPGKKSAWTVPLLAMAGLVGVGLAGGILMASQSSRSDVPKPDLLPSPSVLTSPTPSLLPSPMGTPTPLPPPAATPLPTNLPTARPKPPAQPVSAPQNPRPQPIQPKPQPLRPVSKPKPVPVPPPAQEKKTRIQELVEKNRDRK